ncbi:hypothetical protein [Asaia platycodi]|uniref:hypothetical protein n=1 Tax=Asaia platycodi TaxID=610243 RepID=UPI00046EE479|nr:hypothetical protein [Asaia platycodi]
MTTALLSLPLWMQFLAGFILLGLGLMFILMPFSIFGVKPRLEEVELQLNEVRAELRIIAMRLAQGGSETGPSGEPVFAPPRRSSVPVEPAAPVVTPVSRAVEPPRASEPMPWSSEASRQAAQRAMQQSAATPRQESGAREAPAMREALRDVPLDERRERPAPLPEARDDYSYAESGAQESVHRILRPTHFEPPPPREAPRPPRPPMAQDQGSAAPVRDEQQEQDDAWRLRVQRQEMAPRSAAAEAERLRQGEEAGARRVRSEPTLRWPPRP